jgi:hypothetical protein
MTPADSRRIRLVSEGVVASYIHDISARTGSPSPARTHGARADRLAPTRRARRRRTHARRDYQAV